MPEIIDRKTAIGLGLKRYFTGRPCFRGHLAERIVSKSKCIVCERERDRDRYRKNPEREIDQKHLYYIKNTGKIRERVHLYQLMNREKIREYGKRHRARMKAAYMILKELGVEIQLQENNNA